MKPYLSWQNQLRRSCKR